MSTLVRPWSHVAVGRNVSGPWVWQAHRFHRGFSTFTEPKRVFTGVLPESLVVCRRPQWRHARRCSRFSLTCCATIKSCTPASSALLSARLMPRVSIANSCLSIPSICLRCSLRQHSHTLPRCEHSCPEPPPLLREYSQSLVGFLQTEALRLQGATLLQPLIDAAETVVHRGAQQVPGLGRLIRTSLSQHQNASLHHSWS